MRKKWPPNIPEGIQFFEVFPVGETGSSYLKNLSSVLLPDFVSISVSGSGTSSTRSFRNAGPVVVRVLSEKSSSRSGNQKLDQ